MQFMYFLIKETIMKDKKQIETFDSNKRRVFARQIAYKLTEEQLKQVSGGLEKKKRCRGTPNFDVSCDIY